jgi:uridine kinase
VSLLDDVRTSHDIANRKLPLLILITGSPCTGKTTLARRLAERLSRPLMAKDTM